MGDFDKYGPAVEKLSAFCFALEGKCFYSTIRRLIYDNIKWMDARVKGAFNER